MASRQLLGKFGKSHYDKLGDLLDYERTMLTGDPDVDLSSEDWGTFNKMVQEVADVGVAAEDIELTDEQYDNIASGQDSAIRVSDMVAGMLTVDGKYFDFSERQFFLPVYDQYSGYEEGSKNIILQCGRQLGKSTAQSSKSIGLGMIHPHYKTLYIAPRFNQVVIFSQQRFKVMCEESPQVLGTWAQPSKYLWQVACKQFANGSMFNFRSCYLNADGARGISANNLMIDEIQDIDPNSITVLEECQSHSIPELTQRLYAGTAKSSASLISKRWDTSCQFEWLVRCTHCNNDDLCREEIIRKEGYMCTRCGKEIFPKIDGRWVPYKTAYLDRCWGFRIPQIISPVKRHKDIYNKYTDPNVSRMAFHNEVLGLSYDLGEVGITDTDLRRASQDYGMQSFADIAKNYAERGAPVFAGVDYGTAEGDNPSFTILCIGALMPNGIIKVLNIHKFVGKEADLIYQVTLIDSMCRSAGVKWLGADWGFGVDKNMRLEREFGWQRFGGEPAILEFQYVGSKKEAVWAGKNYHIDRTETMTRMIQGVKNFDKPGGIVFPNFGAMEDFKDDFTTVTMEYNSTTGRSRYIHSLPDDAFHACNYMYLASRQYREDLCSFGLPQI